ncbi:MAG: CbiX/SirB N-terminal domain-containing protein [Planctomycetaceae bacterium]|nr:CbiX/SirB N-terminal domain-containing protein [Planctomycetaceae bacterium]MCA9109828.1 CbiX/SirB N-terminal domain-containing protein [Planctomycetaceae bacterium]
MRAAILLIAHGSRVDAANADLRKLAAMISERIPEAIVEYAYLELAEPSIPDGLEACVERGAEEVRMLPWFLSAGSHVTHDLEANRRRFIEKHPAIECSLCPPLGLHPLMIELVLARLEETF